MNGVATFIRLNKIERLKKLSKINPSKWKDVFYKDIRIKLKHSSIEFKLYQQNGRIIHLQQACNKLFSATENYMMLKYKHRVRSYQQLLDIVSKNNVDSVLMSQVGQLHYFYYNGELQMSRKEAVILYKHIMKIMKSRIKN